MPKKLREALRENNFDPVNEMLALYGNSQTTTEQKVRVLMQLAKLTYPNIKAVGLNQKSAQGLVVQLVDFPDPDKP